MRFTSFDGYSDSTPFFCACIHLIKTLKKSFCVNKSPHNRINNKNIIPCQS